MILCNRKMMTALLCATAVWSARAAAVLPAVRVEKVGEISRTEAKTYVGTVHGSETVDIVARINGVMWKSAFKEGSIVRKGDLLFQIEDTIYRENVNAAHAALDQNQAELNYAAKEKARYEKLYKSSATAQTTYENAIRTFKVSEAKTLEAKAKLVLAENDLSYTKIRAPLSGRIGRNVYSEGNYITPEKGTLATIVQFDPIEVRFAMSEADFFKYSKNGTLASDGLEIIRADGRRYGGKFRVDFLDNQIDSKTGTLMIQLKGENPQMELVPGGFVMVKFHENFAKPLPAVSVTAVMTDGKRHYVYAVGADNKVERRYLELGAQVGGRQAVLSGLKAGDTVITGGLHKVKPGDRVEPVFTVESK